MVKSHNRKKTTARIEFGELLRNRRRELGLTQEDLAERSGLHSSYIGSVERGERNVALEAILALANALQLSLKLIPKDLISDRQ